MKPKGNKWADHYTRQAQKDRYPARSVYKLQEIQKKHRIIRKGAKVLDLGCAPGSWLLFAAAQTGGEGRVVGIDLKPVTCTVPGHVQIFTADIFALDATLDQAVGTGFDTIISDMAPNTTGNKDVDAARSFGLCEKALEITGDRLKPGGGFVCKIFQGGDFQEFINLVKKRFLQCHIFKPRSSRKHSKETFVIGQGKK
ncbi:MAG: RlmE family RNA methyltransferase [Desulfobacteraceae bacterium]|nr:RlmE family RNA methyltransferase [Desulfobacteraceae bacterium]